MLDLSKPIPMEVIVGSIVFVVVIVGIGLAITAYYKKKLKV
ncbi:hypothetical protein MNB_SV-5-1681 [hydrothermal vent metagenome]|uniref:DUF3149 domain-containing protein n=1 Tax=hydrothermal vent metagenome TaxID=652676 RepID=A0A1W1EDB8_9ZZZZ